MSTQGPERYCPMELARKMADKVAKYRPADPDDLVSECAMEVLRLARCWDAERARQPSGQASFLSFAFMLGPRAVAHRLDRQEHKWRRGVRAADESARLALLSRHEPAEPFDLERYRSRLMPRQYDALTLRMRGLTLQQVGEHLGCTREAVRQSTDKALQTLRGIALRETRYA